MESEELTSQGIELSEGIFSKSREILVKNKSNNDRLLKKGQVIGFGTSTRKDEICSIHDYSDEEAEKLIQQMREKGQLEKQDSGDSYKKVRINPDLDDVMKKLLQELVYQFRDMFAEILQHPADLPPREA